MFKMAQDFIKDAWLVQVGGESADTFLQTVESDR